jgi:hypothetical protein
MLALFHQVTQGFLIARAGAHQVPRRHSDGTCRSTSGRRCRRSAAPPWFSGKDVRLVPRRHRPPRRQPDTRQPVHRTRRPGHVSFRRGTARPCSTPSRSSCLTPRSQPEPTASWPPCSSRCRRINQHDQCNRRPGLGRFAALPPAGGPPLTGPLRRPGSRHAGDGFFAAFDGPAGALRCAAEIATRPRASGFSSGSACIPGEVRSHGLEVVGMGVHIAARVAALAEPGRFSTPAP